MASTHRYLHYDVFTHEVLAGNQLAVFPDGGAFTPEQMQRIAREMNFSETTFVLPSHSPAADARVRIFTPGTELPMAGHPTVGTAFALAEEGVLPPGRDSVTFELGIGPVPVRLEWEGDRLASAWMSQSNIEFEPQAVDLAKVAAAIGVDTADICTDVPVESGSVGVPFLLIPLVSREAVDRAAPNSAALQALAQESGAALPVFVFSVEPGEPRADVYSRMFAAGFGIAEDPATGSASGPLGAYLVRHGLIAVDVERTIVSLQGNAMGRPSYIRIRLVRRAQNELQVEVGGHSVLAGRAELYL